ncbi:MAG: DoxX family protein [Patescibacteria group bacterium]
MKCFCSHKDMGNLALLALRIVVGVVFLYHGWAKLQDMAATVSFFDSMGIFLPAFFAWVVALVETIGGILLILGVHVRSIAPLLFINMIVALLVVHTRMPWAQAELPLTLAAASLILYSMGAGEWRLMKKECVCSVK